MQPLILSRFWRSTIFGLVLGGFYLTGCASAPGNFVTGENSADAPASSSADLEMRQQVVSTAETSKVASNEVTSESPAVDSVEQPAPQLIREARMVLLLPDIETAIETAQARVQQAQGDLLELQDQQPRPGSARQVFLTFRVPQGQLDPVLADLRSLGTIQQQSITVEDVSSQLVDLTARLKNLRQSEAALLKIMERSGEIADVLEVSRELSSVRENIERLDAQQQALKQRVAYSRIFLTLESTGVSGQAQRPLGETLGGTWQTATQSVQGVTVGLLKISLWLLAYSPYLALLGGIALGVRYLRSSLATSSHPAEEQS